MIRWGRHQKQSTSLKGCHILSLLWGLSGTMQRLLSLVTFDFFGSLFNHVQPHCAAFLSCHSSPLWKAIRLKNSGILCLSSRWENLLRVYNVQSQAMVISSKPAHLIRAGAYRAAAWLFGLFWVQAEVVTSVMRDGPMEILKGNCHERGWIGWAMNWPQALDLQDVPLNPQHVCGEGQEKDVFPSTEPLILVSLTCLIRPKYLAEAFQTKNRQPAKTTFWDS